MPGATKVSAHNYAFDHPGLHCFVSGRNPIYSEAGRKPGQRGGREQSRCSANMSSQPEGLITPLQEESTH